MTIPWLNIAQVDPGEFETIRREAIFASCKWDPQVEDVATLSPLPIVLKEEAWTELAGRAENLAAELAEAEQELLGKPHLHGTLGLPPAVLPMLKDLRGASLRHHPRLIRFDFHFTPCGWKISEANTDVPGGISETSGFGSLLARQYPGMTPAGDPAGEIVRAIRSQVAHGGTAALVHATAFTDDRQVMVYLARRLEDAGIRAVLAGPDHLRWRNQRAFVLCDWFDGAVDFIYRFFPGEWLVELPKYCVWQHLSGKSTTPICNPAAALLTQSKRFPLVWNDLETDLGAWRELLPETRDLKGTDWSSDESWVLKPCLGRVGDMIGLRGTIEPRNWKEIARAARKRPELWVAQRRFETVPMETESGPLFPCIGVYTVEGKASGAYGRLSRTPLTNHLARDAAVLIEKTPPRQFQPFESDHARTTTF